MGTGDRFPMLISTAPWSTKEKRPNKLFGNYPNVKHVAQGSKCQSMKENRLKKIFVYMPAFKVTR